MSNSPVQLRMDVIHGKCHVFRRDKKESIYSSENAFAALKYIANENMTFNISDIASVWIDIESHEAMIEGMKEQPRLFGRCA
jgi:hypothetical protein